MNKNINIYFNDKNVSSNFNSLRALSLSFILLGHYFKDISGLWVFASYGLMVFSYSSSFFTTQKYTVPFNVKKFFIKKFDRLCINLLVINMFAGILNYFINDNIIWDWQAPFHFFGLSALIEWTKIPLNNPFGGGRWFLTVLFLFYGLFPILTRKINHKTFSVTVLFIIFISCYLLNCYYYPRPGMWLSICGFAFGFFNAKHDIRMPYSFSIIGTFLIGTIFLVLNFIFKISVLNFALLFLLFALSITWLPKMRVPVIVNTIGALCSKYFLEIYLIHGLLFVNITNNRYVNLLTSIMLIVVISILLRYISETVKGVLKKYIHTQST